MCMGNYTLTQGTVLNLALISPAFLELAATTTSHFVASFRPASIPSSCSPAFQCHTAAFPTQGIARLGIPVPLFHRLTKHYLQSNDSRPSQHLGELAGCFEWWTEDSPAESGVARSKFERGLLAIEQVLARRSGKNYGT